MKPNQIIFVDYENRHELDLEFLDESYKVIIFIGANQSNKRLVSEFAKQEIECKVEYLDVPKPGKNSLDFLIAYKLGELQARSQHIRTVYILSADKGFDSLIEYIRSIGKNCIRIEDISEVIDFNAPPKPEEFIPDYDYDDHDSY